MTLEKIQVTLEKRAFRFGERRSTSRIDLSSSDTSKVSGMRWMFSGCSKLNDVKYDKGDSKLSYALSQR